MNNEMTLLIKAISANESFARSCVAAFCASLNPSLDEINDIKTAVSEAVTNSVVHAYPSTKGEIKIKVKIIGNEIKITITDFGIGIADISQAKQPFFTSKPEQERSGMGFTVMESFMDSMEVQNNTTRGVTVHLTKSIRNTKSQVVGG